MNNRYLNKQIRKQRDFKDEDLNQESNICLLEKSCNKKFSEKL